MTVLFISLKYSSNGNEEIINTLLMTWCGWYFDAKACQNIGKIAKLVFDSYENPKLSIRN